jgi:FkbM family methyltransferase
VGAARRPNLAPQLSRRIYRRVWQAMPVGARRRLFPGGILRIPVDASHSFAMMGVGGYIESDLVRFGYGKGWEGVSLRAWARLAAGAGTIVDIGAYRGIYALAAKAMNTAAKVIAFEPVAANHQRLVDNARLNGFDITAEEMAVSDSTGTEVLFSTQRGGFSSLESPPDRFFVEVEVPTTSLDDYLDRLGLASVDLVKIDVEGHEAAVLRGMHNVLGRSKPTLLMEVLTDAAGAAEMELIHAHGYEMFRIHENDGLEPITTIGGQIRGSRNILLCQPEVFEAAGLSELLIR